MHLIEVITKRHKQLFLEFPRYLYRSDPEFIAALNKDIDSIFDKKYNPMFKKGNAKRWILVKENIVIGRVAAFYSGDMVKAGIGFYDCVDCIECATILLEGAENWLRKVGYLSIHAPINFGERDKFWGLLVEGFKRPSYQENYNFPYYKEHFEKNGYVPDFDQITSEASLTRIDTKRFEALYEEAYGQDAYEYRQFVKSNKNKFIRDILEVYNKAWREHDFYRPLSFDAVEKLLKSARLVIRDDLIWFVYKDGIPVGFYASVLDVNQVLKKLDAKMGLWQKLKLLYYMRTTKFDRTRAIAFGIVPEHQGRGIYIGMVLKMFETFDRDPYLNSTELSLIGDFNDKMNHILDKIGAVKTKRHVTYKKDI